MKVTLRRGKLSDVESMNDMGVDIGGDVVWDKRRVYHVAIVKGKLVGYFGLAYLNEAPYAFGSGLAVHPDYRKCGIGSSLMAMGIMEARHRKVQWVGTTTKYYNYWFFHNRGWYAIKRADLNPDVFGALAEYPPFFDDKTVMPMVRPMGKIGREVRFNGLEAWLASKKPGLLAL